MLAGIRNESNEIRDSDWRTNISHHENGFTSNLVRIILYARKQSGVSALYVQ